MAEPKAVKPELVLRTEWGVLVIDPDKVAITKGGHIRPHAAGMWADDDLRTNIRRVRRDIREQKGQKDNQ